MAIIPYPTGGERLTSVVQLLQQWGLQDFFLPFMLFFGLIFAILQKIKIFGTSATENDVTTTVPDRKLNGIISAVVSALIVVPHVLRLYPQTLDPIDMLMQFLPLSTIGFIVLVFGLLFVGMVSKHDEFETPSAMRAVVGLAAAAIVLISFLKQILPSLLPQWLVIDPTTQAVAIVIAVMLIVIFFITGESSGDDTPTSLRKMFGGT